MQILKTTYEILLTAAGGPLILVVHSGLTPRGAGSTAERASTVALRAVEAGVGARSTGTLGGTVGGSSDLLGVGGLVAERAGGAVSAALAPAVFVAVSVSVEGGGGVGAEAAFSLGLSTGGSSGGLGLAVAVRDGISGGLAVGAFLGLAGPRVSGAVIVVVGFFC